MCPFKPIHSRSRQPGCLIHGLEGLVVGAEAHYDRLLWLTNPQTSYSRDSNSAWFFKHLQTRLTLLSLYQDYFPNQWQHSHADMRLLDLDVHTPRELEFFELLNEHRFPCEFENGLASFEPYCSACPLTPEWGEIDWLEWDCLVQCCAGLTGYYNWEDVLEQYKLQDQGLATPIDLKKVSLNRLKALCQELESPLKDLHRALEIMERTTGNLWLDSCYMEPETMEWSRTAIERFTEAYQEAERWIQDFNSLNDWLYEQPERIRDLVTLWNDAQIEPDARQLEIPFVTTISSQQWASGTYFQELQATRRHYEQLVYGDHR